MKQKEVRYDWAKFGWIGSSDKSDYLLYMRADLPYKTLADVRKAKEPPKCGSTERELQAVTCPSCSKRRWERNLP